jgi:hypothetical protein
MKNFTPSVSKSVLLGIAGLAWSGVGLLLCGMAWRWLIENHTAWAVPAGLLGLAVSLVVYRFGFSHIARTNIQRIQAYLEKACVFAFMPWKSWILMVGMMGLGMLLRSSSLPRLYLVVIYATIGGGLFFSSLHYYPPALRSAPGEVE